MTGNKGGRKGSPLIALHGLNLCRSLSNHKESLTKFTKQKCGCSNQLRFENVEKIFGSNKRSSCVI